MHARRLHSREERLALLLLPLHEVVCGGVWKAFEAPAAQTAN